MVSGAAAKLTFRHMRGRSFPGFVICASLRV